MKWPGSIQEARKLQEHLRKQVRIIPFSATPRCVAGVDAAFTQDSVVAAACLYSFPDMTCLGQVSAVMELRFPYVPGFLAFREAPAIIAAVRKLQTSPDIILVDGQGTAHPRGLGIACHIGVLLDIPTIGCAKSRLVGNYREPATGKGSWEGLEYEGKDVGAVVRTRNGVRPLFVSPGHRIDGRGSIKFVLACTGSYRIPEPLRCADAYARTMK
jgi:deoxyribonuclease V